MALQDKVVLVTGAGRGIGEGLARDFGRHGCRVAVHYYREAEEAGETCRVIEAAGGMAAAFAADLSLSQDRERLFAEVLERFGRLDVLVNNAGLDPGEIDFLNCTEAQYNAVLDLNLRGLFFCIQAAARQMVKQGSGGQVVNISSIQGQQTFPNKSAYAASKGGIDALTRALALDLAPHGIRVNAIAPGFIEVDRSIRATPDYDRQEVGGRIPIGRVGVPADISALAIFLASDESAFITGQVILSDGGSSCRMAF
jgi:glucose 1-dehydrogenase/3-oxoacyl-[acyl-carrier protein] reductase